MKYKTWLVEWLSHEVKPSMKSKTCERYTQICEQHVIPALGECEMPSMTPMLLQRFVSELSLCGNLRTGEGLAPNSVNAIVTVLRISLKRAAALELAPEGIVERIKRPRVKEREISCFTPEEQRRLEAAISGGHPKLIGILVCLYTGLRIGELLALRWEDIDFDGGMIHVRHSCRDAKDETGQFCRITDTPKTNSSIRKIPLPRPLLSRLRAARKRSLSELVIADGDAPPTVRGYQRTFEVMLQRLGIRHRGFHALRHTFATRAIECGMDVRTLAEILGHKNPSVTLSRYAHSLSEHKRQMMNKLGRLLQ